MFQCNKITLEVTLHNYFMNHDMRAANENNKSKCITAIIVKLHLSFCLSLVKIFFVFHFGTEEPSQYVSGQT